MIMNMSRKEKCEKCGKYAADQLVFEPVWFCRSCGHKKRYMSAEEWREYRSAMRGY